MKAGEIFEMPACTPAAPEESDLIKVSRVTFLGAGPHGQALSMGWPAPVYQMVENILYGDTSMVGGSDKYVYSWKN
ncbi:MAG: hypothetical protein FWG42_12210 [Clostridiales bacterium]|nr:hypothetical protein [Clostridiales bacterium]